MHAVGEGATGRTVQDNIDEWQAFLRRTPLAAIHDGRDVATTTVKIKLPDEKLPKGVVGFKTPSGGTQEVRVPKQARPGDVIEIPMVDIYVAA